MPQSPGVFINEFDASQQASLPSGTIVAMLGGATWGPANEPTVITNDGELVSTFGSPMQTDYGLQAALRFLHKGTRLVYVRVVDGNEAKADRAFAGTEITTPGAPGVAVIIADGSNTAPVDGDVIGLEDSGSNSVTFEFDDDATNDNASDVLVSIGSAANANDALFNLASAINNQRDLGNIDMTAVYSVVTTIPRVTVTQGTNGTAGNTALTDTPVGAGGTALWTVPANFSGGTNQATGAESAAVTFTALYHGTFGNGIYLDIVKPSVVPGAAATSFDVKVYAPPVPGATAELVETFKNVNLTTGDARNLTTVLTNGIVDEIAASNYVRATIASGALSLDAVTGRFIGQGGGTAGADGVATLAAADYSGTVTGQTATGLRSLDNPEEWDLSLIAIPGVSHADVVSALITFCDSRKDVFGLIDAPFGLNTTTVVAWTNGGGGGHSIPNSPTSALSSTYAAVYWPWVKVYDNFNKQDIWIPPSGFVAAQAAETDRSVGPWFPFAGPSRGKLGAAAKEVEFSPSQTDRDTLLGDNNVNPIVSFSGEGVLVYGNKSLQRTPSPTDRVNTRRMLIYATKAIRRLAQRHLVMEFNDSVTWKKAELLIKGVLQPIAAARGLTNYQVTVNANTNPEAQRQQRTLRGRIILQPADVAETVVLDFNITNTSATFAEVE